MKKLGVQLNSQVCLVLMEALVRFRVRMRECLNLSVSPFGCICLCVYVIMYVCKCAVHTCISLSVCMHYFMYICMYLCIFAIIHVFIYVYASVDMYPCVCIMYV